jgi:sugar phosphate isomerase/epimerase
MLTRRDFGKLALVGVPGTLLGGSDFFTAFAQAKPNSLIDGVQIGTITYSYRSMPDQTAEATLRYIVESGISAVELMGGPVESFAGAPTPANAGGGGGRGQSPGGGGRGPAAAAPVGRGTAGPSGPAGTANRQASAPAGSWNGEPCAAPGGGGGGGGRGRGRGEISPEQRAAQQEQAEKLKAWRTSVSMDPFKKLRRMYNDAGVTIYAWKQLSTNMSDEEYEYIFNVAEALGCTHTTLELPTDAAQLKRLGAFAMKKKIYAAYHTHTQGNMTAFDQAFALSEGNKANVDFGHWVAGGNVGGTPMQFLQKYHDRIASYHLKDRTTPEHCALNLPWGTGETPIKEILQMVRTNNWKMPGSVELEYSIPAGSDAVTEVRKCVNYCRTALADKA